MGLMNIPLDLMTITISAIAIGIGVVLTLLDQTLVCLDFRLKD
jgi:hypothetical protein